MEQHLRDIRDQQKNSWNKFSGGWRKWDDLTMDFLKPSGDAIISRLQLAGNEKVLDIAAGTGEPGLTIARIVKNGKVVITDLAEDMLRIAEDHAMEQGIRNVETIACDVSELPFDDDSFDAVSCRMGFMFFPDVQIAANEMWRVLKPGGRIATSVWNVPEKNFWVTATMGTINKLMELPALPPGSPGMFRCAKPGLINDILKNAGFKNIIEEEVASKLTAGKIEDYWGFMTEVAAPVVAALNKADDNMKVTIKKQVFELVRQKYPDDPLAIDTSAIVISGEK